jgi:hypothetical protein
MRSSSTAGSRHRRLPASTPAARPGTQPQSQRLTALQTRAGPACYATRFWGQDWAPCLGPLSAEVGSRRHSGRGVGAGLAIMGAMLQRRDTQLMICGGMLAPHGVSSRHSCRCHHHQRLGPRTLARSGWGSSARPLQSVRVGHDSAAYAAGTVRNPRGGSAACHRPPAPPPQAHCGGLRVGWALPPALHVSLLRSLARSLEGKTGCEGRSVPSATVASAACCKHLTDSDVSGPDRYRSEATAAGPAPPV